jgi:hypothetical protein
VLHALRSTLEPVIDRPEQAQEIQRTAQIVVGLRR